MSARTAKALAAAVALLLGLLLLPLVLIRCLPATSAMGGAMLLFFAFDPILSVTLGILAGTDVRGLFWLTLAVPILFPLCFSLVILDFTFELYVYSVFYFAFGVLAALTTHLIKAKKFKAKEIPK